MVKSFGVQPGVYLGSVLTHHPAADILLLGQLHKSGVLGFIATSLYDVWEVERWSS